MKGNVIIGQSGGPTSVINSSLVGVYKTAMDRGCKKIFGMVNGIKGLLEGKMFDLSHHITSNLDIELLKRTPSSYLGSCRYKLAEYETNDEEYKKIFKILEENDIKYFFYIGGNDSMDTIYKLYNYGKAISSDIVFIGVPKTIDNDLAETDHTPGYGSAAKYIGTVTKEVIRDGIVYDTKSVTIIEIMGRNAGWLTAASALAQSEDCRGPDMIFLPEIPIDIENFIDKVNICQEKHKSIVIAVSEGVKTKEGKFISDLSSNKHYYDAFGHKSLSGAAKYLENRISTEIGCKTRSIEFSTLQRCASHIVSRVDITEAFQVGGAAVKEAIAGNSGKMITLKRISDDPYQCRTSSFDIDKIANVEKNIPRSWINKEGTYIEKEFLTYARPLIIGELSPIMVDGLPRHLFVREK